jgi:sulfatase maturation enzyme AslB (radical SAM superfamily)
MGYPNEVRELSGEYLDIIHCLMQHDYQTVLKLIDTWKNAPPKNSIMRIIKAYAYLNLNNLDAAKISYQYLEKIESPSEISEYLRMEIDNILKPFQENKPKVINFQINDVCNARCVMCNIWRNKSREEITLDYFSSQIAYPFFSEVESVGITVGEPTLRTDLVDFYIALVKKLPNLKNSSFITNGFLVERAVQYYSEINRYYLDNNLLFSGMVSIDGVEGVHDRVRGVPGAFRKSYRTLFGLLNRDVPVIGCCTITIYLICCHGEKRMVFIFVFG